MFRPALAVTLVALLAACAPTQWRKPGVAGDVQAREIEACRAEARTRSYQELNARVLSQPYGTGMDPRGNATLAPPLSVEGDRAIMERVLMENCMRALGYRLESQDRAR